MAFDPDHRYLKRQLIAYIGNKRRLQPLLYRVFSGVLDCEPPAGGGARSRPRAAPVFLDPFAGSGSVSRLARLMGFRVSANDWEHYAWILNYAHLCIGASEARSLFRGFGGPQALLEQLNGLGEPPDSQRYISRHYAPKQTGAADYRRERLFYTRENALAIDAVRSRIEALYPGRTGNGAFMKEKTLLLASLLYQCATHTNTSGVFKACHKGFGGHSADALSRILKPIRLQMPELIDSPQPAEVGCQDARRFVSSRPALLCYLDPPYNQHQYGSNYHLLNTIALWDKPVVDDGLGEDGRLKHKAAIRPDWTKTRSEYCYRRSAARAFSDLLGAIDARYIVLSYNTEGIIPFPELVELMAGQGRLTLHGNEYVKYRGGKQSLSRQVHNLELLLVVDRKRRTTTADRGKVEFAVLKHGLSMVMKRSFDPHKVRARFAIEPPRAHSLSVGINGTTVRLPMPHHYRFSPEAVSILERQIHPHNAVKIELLLEALQSCECLDRGEEIQILLHILKHPQDRTAAEPRAENADTPDLQLRILWLLRKFAHRKYRDRFMTTLETIRSVCTDDPQRFSPLIRGLAEIEALARRRFDG